MLRVRLSRRRRPDVPTTFGRTIRALAADSVRPSAIGLGAIGLVLAEELKRIRAIPVVLLTGWADELDAAQVPHIDVVVGKPITRERLLDAIARAVPERVRSA